MNRELREIQCSRRDLLRGAASLAAFYGIPKSLWLPASKDPEIRASNMILLWLNGGPSHLDTFDPKPGTRTGGPFQAMSTSVDGMQICEHLPRLASNAQHLAIVRSLTSKEADHTRANHFLHTGHLPQETVKYPGFLSYTSKEQAGDPGCVPAFVRLAGGYTEPGLLGASYAPLLIPDPNDPQGLFRGPEQIKESRQAARRQLLERMNSEFQPCSDRVRVEEEMQIQSRALALLGPEALAAFDVSQETDETRARYGDTDFGRSCLLARRLVEHGVRFQEISLENWDSHADNFNVHQQLMQSLDSAFASLIEDLSANGLLQQTLILCMGEFGRTPDINPDNGRDHHSAAFSAVLAGGGTKCGQVIGATDALGYEVANRPVTIPDLVSTIFHLAGIDPHRTYKTPEGRPIKLVDGGEVIHELL